MTNIITNFLVNKAYTINQQAEKESRQINEKNCSVCGHNKFIQKFRNVVGEIDGSMYGSYSFFSSSFRGKIDGYTKTLPVLSCRDCGNEREIDTYTHTSSASVFQNDMFYFYFGVEENNQEYFKNILQIYLDNPLETREFLLENQFRYDKYDFCCYSLPNWESDRWVKAGFKFPFKTIPEKVIPEKVIPPTSFKFLFWTFGNTKPRVIPKKIIPEQKIYTFFKL